MAGLWLLILVATGLAATSYPRHAQSITENPALPADMCKKGHIQNDSSRPDMFKKRHVQNDFFQLLQRCQWYL
eukprot:3687950-Karenia_brevis.AAC.1